MKYHTWRRHTEVCQNTEVFMDINLETSTCPYMGKPKPSTEMQENGKKKGKPFFSPKRSGNCYLNGIVIVKLLKCPSDDPWPQPTALVTSQPVGIWL